jgi:hypothetical protein
MLTACGEGSPTSTPSDTKGGVRAGGLTANGVAHVGQDDPGGAAAGGEGAGTDPADVWALVPSMQILRHSQIAVTDGCMQPSDQRLDFPALKASASDSKTTASIITCSHCCCTLLLYLSL